MQEYNNNFREDASSIDLKKILNVVWGMRWIILASVILCLALAYIYNRVTRTRYTANAKILLVTKGSGSADMVQLTDLVMGGSNSKVTNEIEVINSRGMMQRVVEELGLNYGYSKKRPVKSILYYGNNPFVAIIDSTENFATPPSAQLTIVPLDSATYKISKLLVGGKKYPYENKTYAFGEAFAVVGIGRFDGETVRPFFLLW